MENVFSIDGKFLIDEVNSGIIDLKDIKLYINIPEWIEERNVYDVDTHKQIGVIKPRKFQGLTYYIYDIIEDFVKVKTITYGYCLVRITEATTVSNYPYYINGGY